MSPAVFGSNETIGAASGGAFMRRAPDFVSSGPLDEPYVDGG